MVEALTLDNYVKCITDPYYFAVLKTTLHDGDRRHAGVRLVARLSAGALPRPRTTSRFKAILILAVILPLFVGNAVRAAGLDGRIRAEGRLQLPPRALRCRRGRR